MLLCMLEYVAYIFIERSILVKKLDIFDKTILNKGSIEAYCDMNCNDTNILFGISKFLWNCFMKIRRRCPFFPAGK